MDLKRIIQHVHLPHRGQPSRRIHRPCQRSQPPAARGCHAPGASAEDSGQHRRRPGHGISRIKSSLWKCRLRKSSLGSAASGSAASGNKELKFDFHIETKPGGGFSLHSHDPNATTIEGASHEEIEHPFAEKLAGVVGKYFLPELSQALAKQGGSGDIKVFVERKVSFTANPGSQKPTFGSTQDLNPAGTPQPQGATSRDIIDAGNNSPITYEASSSWPIFRFLLTLLVIAALMYFFLHHHR